jgi:hypothetical protein
MVKLRGNQVSVSRLLVVLQGPSQALAVLPILRNRTADRHAGSCVEVHFLIGDLCAAERTEELLRSTETLLLSLGYVTVRNTIDLDNLFYNGKLSFSDYCQRLQAKLDHDTYHEVYVCRRSALLNEAVLTVFAGAKKTCYGDGLGCLDNGWPKLYAPIGDRGFSNIDECRAIIPFEANYRGSAGSPVAVEGSAGLREIIPIITKAYTRELDLVLNSAFGEKGKVCLITTSNLTESGAVEDLEDEISLYRETMLTTPLLEPEAFYLVKGHPRETHRQAALLANELKLSGFKAQAIGPELLVPTEVLIYAIRPHEIIPLFSSSGYAARLLDPSIAIRYDLPLRAVFRKWIRAKTSNWTLLPEKLQALTLLASYPWAKCVSHLRFLLNALLFRGLALCFPSFDSTKMSAKSVRFTRLQNSPCSMLLYSGSGITKRRFLVAQFTA